MQIMIFKFNFKLYLPTINIISVSPDHGGSNTGGILRRISHVSSP